MVSFSVENIQKKYGEKEVLKDVSFSANPSEVLGLIGTNGAGKTTLIKIIAGLSKPDSGKLRILARCPRNNRSFIRQQVALVPQENNLERECTVFEVLYLYARLFGVIDAKQRVREILHDFTMQEWQTKKVEHLSGGMARKVLIARAMLTNPKIVLLDEPSVGLDPDVRQEIWQMILKLRSEGKTILITTHYMDEAEFLCDRVALLKEGRLLYMDTVEALKEQVQNTSEKISLETAFLHFIREKEKM